jgi:hypothetical protein
MRRVVPAPTEPGFAGLFLWLRLCHPRHPGVRMGDFEFLAGFYGILLGLIVAEVAVKLADAIDSHARRPIGWLTPMLAVIVLFDVTSFWMWLWSLRTVLEVTWPTTILSTALGITYFLAACLVFPRTPGDWPDLDAHYWARKRWVIGGLVGINALVLAGNLSRLLPAWNDIWFYYWQGAYFAPLIALLFTRKRGWDIFLLTLFILYWVLGAMDVIPDSDWANRLGANGTRAAMNGVAAP